MMESDKEGKQVYTPHLKKVLRSFQASANTSLHGPNSVMGLWRACASENTSPVESTSTVTTAATKTISKSTEDDPFTAPPPFPIQQPPIFTPPDQSGCDKTDTVLENETISCFTVGGEKRLCLPQILNTVLRDFSLQQINCVCDNLHIFCSRCTSEQLEVLKNTGVLPLSAPSCGLITKSDAERLCSALLDSNPPKVMRNPDIKPHFQVRVYHECFGKCTGLYTPELYLDPLARCIECTECHGLFSPQKFVCHAHHPKENRTCHWGFDSYNWRFYLILDAEFEDDVQMKGILKDMKSRYDYNSDFNQKYKRKQILTESRDPNKKVRIENFYPYPYAYDPGMLCWYANPAWSKVATFKPLHPVITSDEKPLFIHPDSLPHFLRDRSPYFLHDPPLIQSSDHVLPLRESERYEAHFHANVAYGPAVVHKLGLKKDCSQEQQMCFSRQVHKAPETISKKHHLKKEPNCDATSCCFESEDAFSDTSSSTLSAGAEESLVVAYEEEEEISPCPVETELQPLVSLLNESGIDSVVCTKVVAEVEGIIAKYRKCLKANNQSKKLMQTEYEKLHCKQREKIKKLKETGKYLEKEMKKLQGEVQEAKSTTTTCSEKNQSTSEQDSLVVEAQSSPKSELRKEAETCKVMEDSDKCSSTSPNVTQVEKLEHAET